MNPTITVLGEYSSDFAPHVATDAAIGHSAASLQMKVNVNWVSTDDIELSTLSQSDGIWIAPGSPYRCMQKTLDAIQFARENGVPCFGTCGGCQHMILEYARNVLDFPDASHAEYDPNASRLFISELECSLAGREMQLRFLAGSKVAEIYGSESAIERYYCNFGVNPKFVESLNAGPLCIVGADSEGEVRVIEFPGHPFFVATLYVPQARSTLSVPHPLVTEFVRVVGNSANPDFSQAVFS